MEKLHEHSHKTSDIIGAKLIFSVLFNLIITLSEIIGGILSGSLALISDALHNLSDTGALLISFFARKISKKPKNQKYTYGYKRAEIIAAIINTTVLLAISVNLLIEGAKKIITPSEIKTSLMLIIAYIGLFGNGFTAILLFSHSKENLNLKSSFLHILSDLFSSIAIIISGHLIAKFNIWILDPIITFLIATYIIIESIKILKESLQIVMQAAPENVDIDLLKQELESLPFVKDVHHIHAWTLDGHDIFLECHVKVESNDYDRCLKLINEKLKTLGFKHNTIQLELKECTDNCVA